MMASFSENLWYILSAMKTSPESFLSVCMFHYCVAKNPVWVHLSNAETTFVLGTRMLKLL